MMDVNLKYDVRALNWFRRSLFGAGQVRKQRQMRMRKLRRAGMLAVSLWVVALAFLVVPSIPLMVDKVFPGATDALAHRLGQTGDVVKSEFGEVMYQEPIYVPPFDESLPKTNRLVIPKIGFVSDIGEAPVEDVESVLRVGPWRVPELGTPELRNAPMVLAAHRFGYIHWTNQYRREHSFFNLPKLENGDRVEIVWHQRKYVYEIYEGYTDTKIRDYSADVILYTCEMLNSQRRIVRVARLIVPEETEKAESRFGVILTYNF